MPRFPVFDTLANSRVRSCSAERARRGEALVGSLPVRGLGLFLWLMLWASLNTGPEKFENPRRWIDLVHAWRSLLWIPAAMLAVWTTLTAGHLGTLAFRGPLGCMALYGAVGLLSGILVSTQPLVSLYWAGSFLSVLLVLNLSVSGNDALRQVQRLIVLNWFMAAAHAVVLVVISRHALLGGGLRFAAGGATERMPGYTAQWSITEVIGMQMVFAAGVARFASVFGLVCLVRLLRRSRPGHILYLLPLLFSIVVVIVYQSRGAVLGFVAGSLVVVALALPREPRILLRALCFLAVVVVLVLGAPPTVETYFARGQSRSLMYDRLSGRLDTWGQGLELVKESVLVGGGFHADRIRLRGQHMHNAWLHALVQAGTVGGVAFAAGFFWSWLLLLRAVRHLGSGFTGGKPLLIDVAGVLTFFAVRSLTESTGAFFGVDWLLLAPIFAYLLILNHQHRLVEVQARLAHQARLVAARLSGTGPSRRNGVTGF